ncbi:hypothetical protein EJ06DRAFT_581380 [Trichodelitschia bisporula]|uniref:SUZ domain-containing protein n=1 Tax=Trichodelitschia bisporula TaxID=703511 RepID=A0A6G1HZE1_9PEZI|nr:hypothetical protein EJ06DRAFT_581380 [Trichodelitschia bisporula]
MSSARSKVPDAWDDDWEKVADQEPSAPSQASAQPETKLSKAERRARHAEANKRLWQAAETPDRPLFVDANDSIPLKTEFKPPVKVVLSRKPPTNVAKSMGNMKLDDDSDSEAEAAAKREREFAERQARAAREREEKQRKYAEARERLFGTGTGSGGAPGDTRNASPSVNSSRNSSRGKGRERADPQSEPADQSPARAGPTRRQLFDPGYTSKPVGQRAGGLAVQEERPIRAPKGPDASGRGGFGFALRGGRGGMTS